MNYYVRYFDFETVVSDPQALIDFVSAIPQITMTEDLSDSIMKFCEDKTSFPRHFRLPNKNTFIVIKTNSETLEEFKVRGANGGSIPAESNTEKEVKRTPAEDINPGLYNVSINFRRAIVNPETRKCSFVDELFEVEMSAESQKQCYDNVVEFLKNNPDIDSRSQYPSIRSANFTATLIKGQA